MAACILYHKPSWPFDQLLAAIREIACSSACKSIFCPGYFDGLSEARILSAAIGKKTRFFSISSRASWQESVNRLIKSGPLRDDALLFLSTTARPEAGCLDSLSAALMENGDISGALPVFISKQETVSGNGDEGQAVFCPLFCVRKADVRQTEGFAPADEHMGSGPLIQSITSARGKPFRVISAAKAII